MVSKSTRWNYIHPVCCSMNQVKQSLKDLSGKEKNNGDGFKYWW
jgi:hypothetical protein